MYSKDVASALPWQLCLYLYPETPRIMDFINRYFKLKNFVLFDNAIQEIICDLIKQTF